ncbi:MAG: BatD family protein [Sulfurimonadaceae bacterium]
MKSLGSVIFLLLVVVTSQADVSAIIDKNRVQKGEAVTVTLAIEGEIFGVPQVETLCGVTIHDSEHRQKIDDVDGLFHKVELYSFSFRPTSDCTIEPIAIEVDGVESYTQPLDISVNQNKSTQHEDITLQLRSSKDELYVGEPFELEVIYKKRDVFEGVSPLFVMPEMDHVWIKKIYEVINSKDGNYSVQKRRYLLAPQQAGDLRIYPAEVKVAYDEDRRDGWGNLKTKRYWQSHYSNTLDIHVKALPEGVTAVGDFTIEMKIETNEVEVDRPFSARITIQGRGNFEDIALIKPAINGVDVFAEDPTLEKIAESDQERWSQRLSFVSDHDFTVPPITLEYFDLKERRIKTLKTEALPIHVIGGSKVSDVTKVIDKQKSEGTAMTWVIATYILGLLSAALFLLIPWKRYIKRRQRAKVSKSDYKGVLRLLLSHKEDEGVQEMIEALEDHLYSGNRDGIDQKELKKLLSNYQK